MAKNELKVLARMTFVADKMVQNMRKCLEKKGDLCQFKVHPAIEPETGLMMATNGHILAVHKLKDYRCELGDGVFVVNGAHMVPAEVTKMKGTVTVEILSDTYDEFVRVTDSHGATAELKQEARYPVWRSVMPWSSGYPITVDAKAWDAVLKDMQAAADKDCPMRVYGERDGRTIRLSHYDDIADKEWSRDVEVGWMPYKMFASFNCRRLRDVMAFQPTGMRFVESTRAVMFTGDETLVLLMPLLGSLGLTCKIENKDYDRFDLAKWMMAGKKEDVRGKKADVKPQTSSVSPQPSFAERLREALLKHYKADEGKRENTKTTTTLVYKFSQLYQLNDEFDRVFGIGFKPFYNGLVSVTSKHLCIDILKFDEWLHKKHGNYEDAGQSMDNCIREHYGDEGVKLINRVS